MASVKNPYMEDFSHTNKVRVTNIVRCPNSQTLAMREGLVLKIWNGRNDVFRNIVYDRHFAVFAFCHGFKR